MDLPDVQERVRAGPPRAIPDGIEHDVAAGASEQGCAYLGDPCARLPALLRSQEPAGPLPRRVLPPSPVKTAGRVQGGRAAARHASSTSTPGPARPAGQLLLTRPGSRAARLRGPGTTSAWLCHAANNASPQPPARRPACDILPRGHRVARAVTLKAASPVIATTNLVVHSGTRTRRSARGNQRQRSGRQPLAFGHGLSR